MFEVEIYAPDASRELLAQKEADGFEIIKTAPNKLLLDLDTPEAVLTFNTMWNFATKKDRRLSDAVIDTYKSKSGNLHAVITLPFGLPLVERLLLEAILGSDLKRSLFSWLELQDSSIAPERVSMLFKPKQKSENVLLDELFKDLPF